MDVDYDIVIIGGRIAGSVAASKLGDAGFSLLIIDKDSFPSNTLSSHFFRGMSALRIFDEIGILNNLLEINIPKLTHQVNFIDGTEDYVVSDAQGIAEIGFNLNMRRYVLDDILNKRVLKTPNVEFMEKTRLIDLSFSDGKVYVKLRQKDRQFTVSAKLVIGADGRNSTVAKLVSPKTEHKEKSHRIMIYRYLSDLSTFDGQEPFASEYSVYQDEVAYIFPTDNEMSLAAISLHRSRLQDVKDLMKNNFHLLFVNHPSMMKRIKNAIPESKSFRSDFKENYLRIPYGHRWVLIGDAGVHLDPWSGLGIDFASIQASLLADVLIRMREDNSSQLEALETFHSRRNEIIEKLYYNTVKSSRNMQVIAEKMKSKLTMTH